MIKGMFDNGAMQTLERFVQFTEARHSVLANNIANISTPYFQPGDLDVGGFQSQLRDAIGKRRTRNNPIGGEMRFSDSRQVRFHRDGISTRPEAANESVMFHDRNNRDLERIMQDVAENTLAHRTGVDLLKNQFDMLEMAIRERV